VFLQYLGENEMSNFLVFNHRYWFHFHKTFLYAIPSLHACENAQRGALAVTVLLKLSSFISVSDSILLSLSDFHVNHVNRVPLLHQLRGLL